MFGLLVRDRKTIEYKDAKNQPTIKSPFKMKFCKKSLKKISLGRNQNFVKYAKITLFQREISNFLAR